MHTDDEEKKLPRPYDVLPSGEMREKYGLKAENLPKISLNPQNVPEGLRSLIPYAERWGIGDDIIRTDTLKAASREELQDLVSAVSKFSEDAFDDWLAGSEAKGPKWSKEYTAFTELRDAYDRAKWRLENWDQPTGDAE